MRVRRILLLIGLATAASILGSGVALAALGSTPDEGTVQANGRVWDILRAGNKVYLAGSFTQITQEDGTTFARNNLAAIDADTGEVTDWNPNVTNPNGDSAVRTMALSSDGSRLYVGGKFTRVGGVVRRRLAAVDPATGAVDRGWEANVDKSVYALAVSGSRLFVGGDFSSVAGQPRELLAAVHVRTGALDARWKPTAKRRGGGACAVRALEVSADGSRIYAGGTFTHIGTTRTGGLAAIDNITASLAPGFKRDYPNKVLAMDVSGSRLYVGTGDPLEGVEALDAATGKAYWSVGSGHPVAAAGDVQAITVKGGTVYAGGHFAQMGGLVRKRLVEFDAWTGKIGPWAPAVAGGNPGVWALERDMVRGHLYAGGDFTKIEGIEQLRFARLSGPNDPVLVGAAKIGTCTSYGDQATAKLLDGISGTVFTAGDNAYVNGTAAEFENCYGPSWGRHKARTKPTPGRHEYATGDASGYFGYFGEAAGDPEKGYYSYNLGEWHVVALNSLCEKVGGCGPSSPMVSWLEQDLAANPTKCTIAYFNHSLFSSAWHGNQTQVRPIWDVLYAADADVVVNGRDHSYERFAPQSPSGAVDRERGIREFVVGTGGAGLFSFDRGTIQPNSKVRNDHTYGVLKLTLHPSSYNWQFVPIAGKTFTDSGKTSCH